MSKFSSLLHRTAIASVLVASISTQAMAEVHDERGVPRLPTTVLEKAVAEDALTLYLGMTADAEYKDNIYKDKNGGVSDSIIRLTPRMRLRSDWQEHMLNVQLYTEHAVYKSHSESNRNGGGVRAFGRYDITPVLALHGHGAFRYDHVEIGSFLDDPTRTAAEPTPYRYSTVGTSLDYHPNEWQATVGTDAKLYNYDNINLTNNTRLINDDRDRMENEYWFRLGRDINSCMQLYTKAAVNFRSYDTQIDSSATNKRDSKGYNVVAGVTLGDKKRPLWMDVYAGYLAQDYDQNFYDDISAPTYGADIRYSPNPTWKFKASAEHSAEENTLRESAGHERTDLEAGIEYNLNEDWTLGTDFRYTLNRFSIDSTGTGRPDRSDHIYDTSVLALYHINDQFSLGAEYIYVKRDSTRSSVEYDSNAIIFRLIAGNF